MKKLITLVAAAGLMASSSGHAQDVSTDNKSDKKAKVSLKKKAKKKPKFSFPINVWQSWGYQTENPQVQTSVYFMPRYQIMKNMSISAFMGVTAEYTTPDTGRRFYFGNTFLGYNYNFWTPKFGKHKLRLGAGLSMILPTDEAARNRGTMRLAIGPRLRFSYTYGIFSLSYMIAFQKYWNGSTAEQISVDASPGPNGEVVTPPPEATTGRANPNYQLMHVAGVALNFTKKLYFASQIWIINQTPYNFGDDFRSPNAAAPNRDSYWLFGEVGYNFSKLFSLGFGFSLSASQLSPDSRFPYLPFNNYNNNFITYLSATVTPTF